MGPRKQRANNAPAPSEWVAGGGGFEPPLRGPEPRVLPLDDPPPTQKPPTHKCWASLPHRSRARRRPVPSAQGAQRIATFRLRLGRKRGTLADGMVICLPVRGSRPLRAARRATTNVPNPEIVTRRPRRRESIMPVTMAFTARSAEILEPPAVFAMIVTRSALIIPP